VNPLDVAEILAGRPNRGPRPQALGERTNPGYRITALAGSGAAEIFLYDVIDDWFGVSAEQFIAELNALDASSVDVHINSPGGMVHEALAIYQSLRNHKAHITTYVDGLAASAASFIAMAGDKRIIAPHAEVMIHDAGCVAFGNAADLAGVAERLTQVSENMAALYASRAGGDKADWRAAMSAETWYSAAEAVKAGLMHEVQADAPKAKPDSAAPSAGWDLSIYAYAGRAHAPAPRITTPTASLAAAAGPLIHTPETPAAEPVTIPEPNEEDPVSTITTDLRSRLGLPDDADDATILAALDALKATAEATPTTPADSADDAEDVPADEPTTPVTVGQPAAVDPALAEMRAQIERLSAEVARTRANEAAATRASVIEAALAAGKIAPAERADWARRYDQAPAVITDILNSIAPGTAVPVTATGTVGAAEATAVDDDFDRIMAAICDPNREQVAL